MNALTFLNQPLLWGLGLASIPILIHLLYRRQYRRVEWAPMRYLKLSIQKNRHRIRIEQLLLLLVRTCIVLLLFFMVARPVMHAAGLSRLWGGGGRTNRIVVLDDSLSMGYADQGKSTLASAQEAVADLIGGYGEKDRLTLVLASRPTKPVLREVELEDTDTILQLVRKVQPSEASDAWEPILQEVDELISGGSYPLHEVTFVTDLRAAGWDVPLAEVGNRWAGERVQLRVIDVGVPETSNVALVNLRQVDRLALAGTPTRFEAEVQNESLGALGELEANLIVDGQPSLVRVPEIPPGETVRVPLVVTLDEAGPHRVEFELPEDTLPGDNHRWTIVEVQQTIDMLLVDGEPSTDPLGGETDFLALALSLAGSTTEPFRVEVLTDTEWASSPINRPDLLVLANVQRLSSEQAEAIERLVADGMGLVIFVGDQVDPDNYNQLLYKGGAGLIGASLLGVADTEFSGLLVEDTEDSPLEAAGQLSPAALNRIKVRQVYELKMPEGDAPGVRVIARWNNASSAPAVVQKVFGQGQVLLWTISADQGWSDWPTEASYVLAMRESTRAIARSTASLRQFVAGQTLSVELPARRDITLPEIETPVEEKPTPLVVATESGTDEDKSRFLQYDETWRGGYYTMNWRDSVAGAMSETFAVNPDRRESDPDRLDVTDFKAKWGALEPEIVSIGTTATASLGLHGQEIWRSLAAVFLGLLVFEACFARWCGRQR